MLEDICRQAEQAAEELIEKAKLHPGQIVVIGCSTSEICGSRIGSDSRPEVAEQVFAVLHRVLMAHGLYLAAQCCEHLNRAIIIEREAVPGADMSSRSRRRAARSPRPLTTPSAILSPWRAFVPMPGWISAERSLACT